MYRLSIPSENGATRGPLDVLNVLACNFVSLRVNLIHIFVVVLVASRARIESVERGLVECLCVEAPEDVLEVEGAMLVINQHHR